MKLSKKAFVTVTMILVVAILALTGCGSSQPTQAQPAEEAKLSGEIRIDGSSTVFPITEAMAEEFNATYPDIKIPIGISGTGGGFTKFTNKETDINDASRPIKEKEIAAAQQNGIEYVAFEVAYDGLSVVINKENTWVDSLTVEELKKIWAPDSTVKTWKNP